MERVTSTGKRLVRLPIGGARVHAGPAAEQPAVPSHADLVAQLDTLQRTFSEYREKQDRALAEARAGRPDAATTEHVDRINAALSEQQRTLDQMAAEVRASRLSGGGGDAAASAAQTAHMEAFRAAIRSGGDAQAVAALRAAATALGGVQASLYSSSDPDGGFFLPTEMDAEISRIQGLNSPMRGICDVRTTTAAEQKKIHNLGGAGGGWVGERATRPETATPELSQLVFPVFEVYAEPHATGTILADAGQRAEAWLRDEVAVKFSEMEGDAWVRGDGSMQPRGYLSYPRVANASWAWGRVGFFASGVAAALTDATNNGVDRLTDMVYGLKSAYRPNAQWVMNDLTQAVVRKIKDTAGQYLWQPSIQVGQPATLLGYPVTTDDNADDIGANRVPIAFADWRAAYRIVDRLGIQVLVDPFTRKPYVKFYTTKRVGGGIQDFQAIKVLRIST